MTKDDANDPPAEASFALSDVLLIGFLTALAYYCSYRFEKGFLAAHHISADFIEVSLGTVLFAVGATFGLFVLVFWIIAFLRPFASPKIVLVLWTGRLFFLVLVGFIYLLVKTGWSTATLIALGFSIFFGWLTYVAPIGRGKGSYWERL